DDPIMRELGALSTDLDIVVGAVVEEPDHRYFNASLYFSRGELVHLHRKVYLPTYGMFDEQRYFAPGDRFRSFRTGFGRAGILVCEDIWHLSSAYILSLEGVDMIICPSSSPGRGITTDERLGTAESYNLVCRTYAQFLTTFFLYCNRVGFEDGANFWGGSMVIGPSGGVDSSLVASLAAEALGPPNVLAVIMPYKTSDPKSRSDALQVVQQLGIHRLEIDISPQIDAYFERFPDADQKRRGNKMARERMTILYDHSFAWRALVIGTSNKTELLLGYGTIYGDMASAINPIGDLYKTQV